MIHPLFAGKEDVVTAVKELVEKLPRANQHLLQGVLTLADQIVANSKCNMMGAENMSRVLGPNLLWQEGQATRQAEFSLELMTRANNLTVFMIEHHASLFSPPVSSFGISTMPEVRFNAPFDSYVPYIYIYFIYLFIYIYFQTKVAILQRKLVGYTRSVQCLARIPSQNCVWGGDNGGKIHIHSVSVHHFPFVVHP